MLRIAEIKYFQVNTIKSLNLRDKSATSKKRKPIKSVFKNK